MSVAPRRRNLDTPDLSRTPMTSRTARISGATTVLAAIHLDRLCRSQVVDARERRAVHSMLGLLDVRANPDTARVMVRKRTE